MIDKSTIQLSKETRSLLSKLGVKGQTYDQVIKDLINIRNRLEVLESQYRNDPSKSFFKEL